MKNENYNERVSDRKITNFGLAGRLLNSNTINKAPLKEGHVYTEVTEADVNLMEGHSVSKNVHEAILKNGLDYLAECAERKEDVGDKINHCMGRAYDKRFVWHTDYQFKLMDAMKKGGIF